MEAAVLGSTGLKVSKDGFSALPLQRISMAGAISLLQRALDGGINLFETARSYGDSEEKLGAALSTRRKSIVLTTKTAAKNADVLRIDLEISLKKLRTDYIDIYQFHNPPFCPRPGDGSGLYEAVLNVKTQGKVRFIGITSHRLSVAREAVESGLYDILQFPFSYLSDEQELALVRFCEKKNLGFIAMKSLSGGLITDITAARAWLAAFPTVVPVWGIQRERELDAIFMAIEQPAELSPGQRRQIEADRAVLKGNFCRACGACMPCPQGIAIDTCARMSLLLRRSSRQDLLSTLWRREMAKIKNCRSCGACTSHCPYGLDIPALLKKNYQDYQQFLLHAP